MTLLMTSRLSSKVHSGLLHLHGAGLKNGSRNILTNTPLNQGARSQYHIHHPQLKNLQKHVQRTRECLFKARSRCQYHVFSRAPKLQSIKLLSWAPGLSLLKNWRNKNNEPMISEEVLANIPKEVLKLEKKKKKARSYLLRFLIWIWETIYYVYRFTRIIVTLGPMLCVYPLISWNERLKFGYWRCLLYVLERTGPTFIKLGQWAGTRRDLFSSEFCDLFSRLHIYTRPHSWHISKNKIRKAFGKRWREILVKVHKRPCGSGCIAQVHKAYMRPDMIPDESLVDEIMEEECDEPVIDFAEGLEIVGLGGIQDEFEDMADEIEAAKKDTVSPPAIDPPTAEMPSGEEGQASDISQKTLIGPVTETAESEEEQLVPVAVKVLHPGVYRAVCRDLRILTSLVWLVEKVVPSTRWLSLRECMDEFSDVLMKQIDLRMEAECLEQFNENFSDHPNIRFPKPVWPYCKRTVLVETFEEGEPLTNFLVDNNDDDETTDGLKETLASFGVDALLQMVFVDNFVHGDLHPGNILVQNAKDFVQQDDKKLMLVDVGDTVIVNLKQVVCPVRLIMLDVGITASLSEQDLENFKAVFRAVVVGEGEKVAELMLRHSRYNECGDVDAFKSELGELVMSARKETISLGTVQVGKLLSQVFSTLSRHKVKMESSFASILIAIFVLEGLGRSLDPEIDILERAKPILLGS